MRGAMMGVILVLRLLLQSNDQRTESKHESESNVLPLGQQAEGGDSQI